MGFIDPTLRRRLAGIAFLVLILGLAGCASTPIHPGAANATDSRLYDSLVSVQASIEQAKTDFGSDPAAKPYLNKIITAYNGAQDAYKSYHELAVQGHAPDATALQSQIAAIVQDLSALQAQFKKGAPK